MKLKNYFFYSLIILLFYTNTIMSQNTYNINVSGSFPQSEITLKQKMQNKIFESAKRARFFTINPSILNTETIRVGDEIQLQLFNDREFKSEVQKKVTDVNGVTSIQIKLEEFNFSYGHIIISKNSYLINIDVPEISERYTTKFDNNRKLVYLLEIDKNTIKDINCGNDDLITKENYNNKHEIQKSQALVDQSETCLNLPSDSDLATIELLIVYTDAAETWANANQGNINNTIALAIADANLVATNNALGITFDLAHSAKVNYTEVSASADLEALRNSTDGKMDEIHTLRKTYNADLVSIFTDLQGDGIGGIANLCTTRYGHPGKAFSNIKVHQATSIYTFMHELSHNMGADHYRVQSSAPGPTSWIDWPENDWSSGWRDQNGNDFRTIMTYSDGFPDPIIPYLSDPNINFTGDPIGDTVLADNARTLIEMKQIISRYSNAAPYCIAGVSSPTAFYISNITMGTINHSSSYSLYSDLTTLATCIKLGESQSFSSQISNSASTNRLKAWVDWNDDKSFDENTELVYASPIGPTSGVFSTTITAPTDPSLLGEKRMRVRVYDPSSPGPNSSPCGNSIFGEIEDYTIILLPSLNTEEYETDDIAIYPNPFNDKIAITASYSINSYKFNLTIYDISGKKVWQQNIKSLNQKFEILGLKTLSKGMYFLEIVNQEENKKIVKKLIKN